MPAAELARWILAGLVCVGASACALGGPPPRSPIPTADQAIARLRAEQACSRALRGETIFDAFDDTGRVRLKALFLAQHPQQVRLDVISPMGGTLATLAADREWFTLLDQRQRKFVVGPADQCSLEQFLRVPIPPEALVQLLEGEVPVLLHEPGDASLQWDDGAYLLRFSGANQSTQEVWLAVAEDTFAGPWTEQRLRVRRVRVVQAGVVLYEAELGEHRRVNTAKPRQDPEGIEPDVSPSGPECRAELPFFIRFSVPVAEQDVTFQHKRLEHNPPLLPGTFSQQQPGGVQRVATPCALRPSAGSQRPE